MRLSAIRACRAPGSLVLLFLLALAMTQVGSTGTAGEAANATF